MPFRAILGPNAVKQSVRRREESSTRDHQIVHEAARFVFCIYHGIPVTQINYSAQGPRVVFQTELGGNDLHVLRSRIQMIMSGAITVQTILVQENRLFDSAIGEANQLYNLFSESLMDTIPDFDELLGLCCKRTIAQLADKKMRLAMASVTRIFNRERSDLRPDMLQRLAVHTRHILLG